ncbi:AraC family transcriptional regulator [Aquimarina sp. 2201CG5-10]|uniref:AraC family transcriptional regulator n=1 Tax=Aquimarina callyspongiae TaxID=3098150 RepID=UPI002AB39883|nr:AraC family transcriptional regulator [Aquimarina sp. 2201CG5-10]MDY8135178.1 AraC family transcriptional regulator [Aquimarina sp. 2201CG5-10]
MKTKTLPFEIPKSSTDTLIVQEDREKTFYDILHRHKEIQMSIVIAGEGKLIVGDNTAQYNPGDIFIFGSNTPHAFKSEVSNEESHRISIFFTKASFGDSFFELSEFEELSEFFKKVSYGLSVLSHKEKLKKLFLKIIESTSKLNRFTIFLKILNILNIAETQTLSSFVSKQTKTNIEGKRIAKVFQSVMNEFNRDFSLAEAASLVNMTPNAFCRYFKQRTNKTFLQFLIEVRIENACKLLSSDADITVFEASLHSGFKNLSNFNRKFKEIKGTTPSKYKKSLYAMT